MPEEVGCILSNMKCIESSKYGDLELFSGEWEINKNKRIFLKVGWSGWGKVSAARAITRILSGRYKIDLIIFTGVARATNKNLNQWDIVIANEVIQHDMDARPIFEKFVLPPLKKSKLESDKILKNWMFNSLTKNVKNGNLNKFGLIKKGLIATGDKFISQESIIKKLKDELPNLDAIEMEGGAVAQVAEQEGIPWIIVRVISDNADSNSEMDFDKFLKEYVLSSWKLLDCILNDIPKIQNN